MEKDKYEKPKIEIISLLNVDIITESSSGEEEDIDPFDDEGEEEDIDSNGFDDNSSDSFFDSFFD